MNFKMTGRDGIDSIESSREDDAATSTYEVAFETILSCFEAKFKKASSAYCRRVYITCNKEYIDEPNKSWWRILLVDAILINILFYVSHIL